MSVTPILLSLFFLLITAVIGAYLFISKQLEIFRSKEKDGDETDNRKEVTRILSYALYGFAITTVLPIVYYLIQPILNRRRVIQPTTSPKIFFLIFSLVQQIYVIPPTFRLLIFLLVLFLIGLFFYLLKGSNTTWSNHSKTQSADRSRFFIFFASIVMATIPIIFSIINVFSTNRSHLPSQSILMPEAVQIFNALGLNIALFLILLMPIIISELFYNKKWIEKIIPANINFCNRSFSPYILFCTSNQR